MEELQRLRDSITRHADIHQYESAVFFGNKLIALRRRFRKKDEDGENERANKKNSVQKKRKKTRASPKKDATASVSYLDDVYLLANALYHTKQHARALHLLRSALDDAENDATERSVRSRRKCQQLAGRCLIASDEIDEASDFLDSVLPKTGESEDDNTTNEADPSLAALYVLKANVVETLESRKKASVWYRRALLADFYCYEAYVSLAEKCLLSEEEERNLLNDLMRVHGSEAIANDPWLHEWYQSRMLKFDKGKKTRGKTRSSKKKRKESTSSALQAFENDPDRIVARAEAAYDARNSRSANELLLRLKETDPHFYVATPYAALALFDLKRKSELFYLAHRLADEHPDRPEAWFAVGLYYLLTRKFCTAQTYFEKCTTIDPHYAPGWVAYGNAFAAQDESDQAMAAYRAASRLLPGCHVPTLYVAMEYVRTSNVNMAAQCLRQARQICDSDPLVFNEIGVVRFKEEKYDQAVAAFKTALDLCDASDAGSREPILVNLGHAMRKLGRYALAVRCFEDADALMPGARPSTTTSLAYAYHLMGELDRAIDIYHKALSKKPDLSFASDMLQRALKESLDSTLTVESIPFHVDEDDAMTSSAADVSSSRLLDEEEEEEDEEEEEENDDDNDMSMMMDDDDDDDDDA